MYYETSSCHRYQKKLSYIKTTQRHKGNRQTPNPKSESISLSMVN